MKLRGNVIHESLSFDYDIFRVSIHIQRHSINSFHFNSVYFNLHLIAFDFNIFPNFKCIPYAIELKLFNLNRFKLFAQFSKSM